MLWTWRITLRLNLSVWFLDLVMEMDENQTGISNGQSSVSVASVLCVLKFNPLAPELFFFLF